MHDFILPIAAALFTGLATGFSGWFYGRKKSNAEAKSKEIGNLDMIGAMWQKTAEQFKQNYHEILAQNIAIQKQISTLMIENKSLTEDVKRLGRLVEELKCENKKLMLRIIEIKKSAHPVKDDK